MNILKLSRKVGTTGLILQVFVEDSSVATGAGKTGIAFNAAGLVAYYKRNLDAADAQITLVTIPTLGVFASGGWKEVDSTNMPGVYEVHIPNAALVTGADSVLITFLGATNMKPVAVQVELTQTDNQDGVRGGMTAIPNGPMMIKKNQALNNFELLMTDSTNHLPVTGAAVAAQRSIDGAAFANCANTVTELSNGIYVINLATTDLNGAIITFKFSASGADVRFLTVFTQP